MANTFKNSISGSIGTVETTVYTTPALTTSTVIGVSVANVESLNSNISVSVKVYDDSTSTNVFLVKDALIPPGSNLVLVGGEQKVVLEPADYLTLQSSAPTSADVVVSVLEIS
jgi:hypothetical protein